MDPHTTIFAIPFIIILLAFPTLSQRQHLITCLNNGGVTNITTQHHQPYPSLLNSSIQNLRYAQPSLNKPTAIIFPTTKRQVAVTIRCLRRHSLTIRLRSGGHSYEGLSSYADPPFALVDLANLKRIKVDTGSETAWVEAGATLGELYYTVAASSGVHGFAGGMCSTVGAGGQISGGGYGALVRKYGLAADNVVDVAMVDAGGAILDRRAMGEEVFWAVRGGGGGNWGAVVSWKVSLGRVPDTVTAFQVTVAGAADRIAQLWHQWQVVAPSLEDEFFLQSAIMAGADQANPINMLFMGLYLGPKPSALTSITTSFPELGVREEDCREMTWVEAMIYVRGDPNVVSVNDLRNRFTFEKTFTKSKADFVRSPIPEDALAGALELVARQPKGSLLLDPYGGMNDRIESGSIPFPHRAGNLYAIEYFVNWGEEDDGERNAYIEWIDRIYDYMEPYVAKNPRTVYVNNVDLDLGTIDWSNHSMDGLRAVEAARVWGEKYFLGNYDRLVRAKTLIDPDNVFKHPQSIPPLISRRSITD